MNRIQQWIDDDLSSALIDPPLEAASNSDSDAGCAHAIFTPLHYERNYAYPLIVWLHSENDDERQVMRIMPLVSARNYAAVGPRGTVPHGTLGFTWRQTSGHIELAERQLLSAIAQARSWLNIAPQRIFLAGLGCGGTMALRLALNQPRAYAGVLSIGGGFPKTLRPLARLHEVRRLNTFLACGRDSTEYPQAEACADLRLFHSAGMSVCLRQYPCGNDLTENMLSDMNRWIMEQLVESPTLPQDQPSAKHGGK